MSESDIWSVDRIAANNLGLSLGMVFDKDQIERITDHFARHRLTAAQWAAERTHSNIVHQLENESMRLAQQHDEIWSEGYRRAEQVVMTMLAGELLGVDRREPRSKGQILRAMVRQAKRQ